MCGIAGYIDFEGRLLDGEEKQQFVENASQLLSHRGPDSYGYARWEARTTAIEFVHTRLAIIDLSTSANQPFYSRDKETTIVFNGEIYNYIELRSQLSNREYRSNSDTEVLLEMYLEHGMQMFRHLEGMFAGAIYDQKTNKVHLFRDHMGIKPLYYFLDETGLVFSSEPKVIRKMKSSANGVNNQQASTFLLFGMSDFSDQTFFNNIQQLQPGHSLTIDLNNFKCQVNRYFNPSSPDSTDFPPTPEGYRALMSDVVKRQLRSDVQVGTSLSGGIDSGIIAVCAGELQEKKGQVKALTYVAPGFENDESEFASRIANNAGLQWLPTEFTFESFQEDFKSLVEYMEEPFGSLSIFAQYNIMKAARKEGCKVMLDGQGGDELYIGYPRLAQRIILQNLMNFRIDGMLREWYWAVKRQEMSLIYPILSNLYFNSYKLVKAKKLNEFSKYVDREYLSNFDEDAVADFYSIKGIAEKQVDELNRFILPRLLRYADRNSMYHSVESRVPHLAQRLVNFSLNLKPQEKIKNGWTKHIVRKAFENSIPKEVIWQTRKIGFDTPQGEWLNKVQPYLESEMDSLGGIIKKDTLLKDLKDVNKANDHGLFRVLSFILSVKSQRLSIS